MIFLLELGFQSIPEQDGISSLLGAEELIQR